MESEVLTALIAATASAVTGIGTYLATRRQARDTAKQLEQDRSGEYRIAELEDAREFRSSVIEDNKAMRAELAAMRSEIVSHEQRCDEKINEAITRSEAECEDKIRTKLASQARQIRKEYDPQLNELRRRLGEISEPM